MQLADGQLTQGMFIVLRTVLCECLSCSYGLDETQYSKPSRITEAESYLRAVIDGHKGHTPEDTPAMLLAVAIHKTPGREDEAYKIQALIFYFSMTSPALLPSPALLQAGMVRRRSRRRSWLLGAGALPASSRRHRAR